VLVGYHDITADRMRREAVVKFAGEVSHDLKNPLTVVSGWTDALLEEFENGPVAPEVGASMARRVQSAAAHMQDFIGNMLDFTVTRDQALSPLDLDLRVLASKVASLRVDSRADGDAPVITVEGDERVWADPLLVRVLLDNLIGNAVKYVAREVRPRIEVRIAAVDEDWVRVGITDNGIGITPDQRDRIFETFARVEQDGYQGTGLGLAICQRIVQRHGGTITVDGATAGPGTVFAFTLPRTEAAYEAGLQAQASGT
jgi:signal transduction histidine kinase